jgi:hypothetical protein
MVFGTISTSMRWFAYRSSISNMPQQCGEAAKSTWINRIRHQGKLPRWS